MQVLVTVYKYIYKVRGNRQLTRCKYREAVYAHTLPPNSTRYCPKRPVSMLVTSSTINQHTSSSRPPAETAPQSKADQQQPSSSSAPPTAAKPANQEQKISNTSNSNLQKHLVDASDATTSILRSSAQPTQQNGLDQKLQTSLSLQGLDPLGRVCPPAPPKSVTCKI